MSVLTTSQLTFCDLKDSYSVHIDTEYVGLACDSNGSVIGKQGVAIRYHVSIGATRVGASCVVSDLPSGVTLAGNTSSTENVDGSILFNVANNATLDNNFTSSVKITLTTLDSEKLTFEKYITFVKSIAGADGTDAVDFQIYSVDGFEFGDSLASITLKTAAFQGGNAITSGATYRWLWWNSGSTLSDKYEVISNATSSTLQVNVSDPYALTSLKCEMKYGGLTYEDHVSLTKKADVYTAIMKFFNGNNVITSDSDYAIAYVELYKNNEPAELLHTNNIYISDANTVQGDVVTTDFNRSNEDLMYFVCKNVYDGMMEYDVVLGKYTSQQWSIVKSNYIYNNDLFRHSTSHVIFIPKEKISRSLSINVDVCSNNDIVARTNAVVLDLNDPMVSNVAPVDPKVGQLWLDTSVSPSVLKMWDGIEWVNSGYQNGNVVYTSQPSEYTEGDLWILSKYDEDLFGEMCAGTMLKATTTSSIFNKDHWADVDQESTLQKQNIRQYFAFNADKGLKIGQTDDKFYVNISSTRMSFCQNQSDESPSTGEYIDPNEVVSISNHEAKIKGLKVEDGATFDCEVNFFGFVLTKESNGSLSLSVQ